MVCIFSRGMKSELFNVLLCQIVFPFGVFTYFNRSTLYTARFYLSEVHVMKSTYNICSTSEEVSWQLELNCIQFDFFLCHKCFSITGVVCRIKIIYL